MADLADGVPENSESDSKMLEGEAVNSHTVAATGQIIPNSKTLEMEDDVEQCEEAQEEELNPETSTVTAEHCEEVQTEVTVEQCDVEVNTEQCEQALISVESCEEAEAMDVSAELCKENSKDDINKDASVELTKDDTNEVVNVEQPEEQLDASPEQCENVNEDVSDITNAKCEDVNVEELAECPEQCEVGDTNLKEQNLSEEKEEVDKEETSGDKEAEEDEKEQEEGNNQSLEDETVELEEESEMAAVVNGYKPGMSEDDETEDQLTDDPKKRLIWAAEKNEIDTVRQLLEEDPSIVDCRDENMYTPLHRAASNNHVEIAKLLISHKADLGARTDDDWCPLHCACRWDSVEVASLLLRSGADINATSKGGLSALHLAAANHFGRRTLELLLWNPQLDGTITADNNDTAYDVATRTSTSFAKLFELLEKSVNCL